MSLKLQVHNALGWILVVAALGLIGFYVPPEERVLGGSYLIFFFHFPSAFNCLLLFVAAGVCGALFLWRRRLRWDHWAAAGIEVGVLACTITLVTGSIWAKAAWGVFWDFRDPRLMTVAIMWFTYVAYLVFRSVIDEPSTRARFSAVFSVIAAVNVPLVYFSIRWFGKEHHPMGVEFDPSMKTTQWVGALAFFVLYTAFWRLRFRLRRWHHEMQLLSEAYSQAGI